MEDLAIKAREKIEDLEKATELAEGMKSDQEAPQPDEEEAEILREMEARADLEIEKQELAKEPKERETKVTEDKEPEKPQRKTEKKVKEKEKPEKEKPDKEKPEILFEE
jgi:hypothetical protein